MSVKIKKIMARSIVMVCACLFGFPQAYKSEYDEIKELASRFSPPPLKYFLNPLSSDVSKNHVTINSVEFKNRISSRNGIAYDKVSYTITPQGRESIVLYFNEADSLMETGGIELFITEDTMYRVKIPEITWHGEIRQREQDKKDGDYRYIHDGRVIDGTYVLKISLLRYNKNENGEYVSESVADVNEIHIVVDTTPPKIEYDKLLVYDDSHADFYSNYVVAKNDFVQNPDCMARYWSVKINENIFYEIESDFAIPLPTFRLPDVTDDDKITITAIDDLGNSSTKSVTFVPERIGSLKNISASTGINSSEVLVAVGDSENNSVDGSEVAVAEKNIYTIAEESEKEKTEFKSGNSSANLSADKDLIASGVSTSQLMEENIEDSGEDKEIENTVTEKKDSRLEYFVAVRNTLLPFCGGSDFDLVKSSNIEFGVVSDLQSLVGSCAEQYPLYICFESDSGADIKRIPLSISETSISFLFNEKDFEKDSYQIFVSDGNDMELRLGKKKICPSDKRKKIVLKKGFDGRERLDIDDIIFPASGMGFLEDDELAEDNMRTIKAAIEIINDNIEDIERVEILGYANPVYSSSNSKTRARENEDVLMPLSKKRADYVKRIMEILGLPADLLVTVPCGGIDYEYNPKDRENKYKNRRVRINVVTK